MSNVLKRKAQPRRSIAGPGDDHDLGLWIDFDLLRKHQNRPLQTIIHDPLASVNNRYLALADLALGTSKKKKAKTVGCDGPRSATRPAQLVLSNRGMQIKKPDHKVEELQGNTVEPSRHLRGALTNRSVAIEHVFMATHGRMMTEEERRWFKRLGGDGGRTADAITSARIGTRRV